LLSALFTVTSLMRDSVLIHLKETDLDKWFSERDQRQKRANTCLGLGVIALSGACTLTCSAWLMG
jgi:hypothetical protein